MQRIIIDQKAGKAAEKGRWCKVGSAFRQMATSQHTHARERGGERRRRRRTWWGIGLKRHNAKRFLLSHKKPALWRLSCYLKIIEWNTQEIDNTSRLKIINKDATVTQLFVKVRGKRYITHNYKQVNLLKTKWQHVF